MVFFRPYLYQFLSLNHHNDDRLVKMRLGIGVAHLTVELETFDGRYIALGTRSGIPEDDVPENGPTVARVDSYHLCHDGTLPPFGANLFIAKPFIRRIGQLSKRLSVCAARAYLFFFVYSIVFHSYNAIPYPVNVLDVTHRLSCHAVRHRVIGRNCGEIPYFPAGRADRVQITGTLKEGLPC